MADSRPARGHPRRLEGIKRLKLRESTYNLWIERKEALGLQGITHTGNDFAGILLHQELTRERDRSPHSHPDDTSVYDICRLQTADCRPQTADRRLQTADCMRQQDCKLNETKNIVIKVASSSTLPCSEKYM